MVNDYMLDKVLDNTKETVGIVKFYDTNSILQEDDSTTLQYIHLVLFFSLVSFLKIYLLLQHHNSHARLGTTNYLVPVYLHSGY